MSSQQVMYHMYVSFQDDDKISIFTMDPATQIHMAPSGRFLYAPNRGHNSVASFIVDASPLAC